MAVSERGKDKGLKDQSDIIRDIKGAGRSRGGTGGGNPGECGRSSDRV